MYSIDIQINGLCCEILKSFTYVLPKNNKKRCNLFSYTVYANRFCDSDRIQTCNLLIRSQVLYSVKLRSHSLIASANVGYFSGLCKFFADKIYPTRKMALWKSGMSAVAGFCGRWAAERVRGSHGGKSGSRQGGGAVSRYAGVGRDRPFGTGRNENGRTFVLPFSLKELPVTPV